jgi:hypothetical protein
MVPYTQINQKRNIEKKKKIREGDIIEYYCEYCCPTNRGDSKCLQNINMNKTCEQQHMKN